MSEPTPFGITVTFITRGVAVPDVRGNDTFPHPVSTVVPNCLYAPGGSTELVQGQDMVTSQPTVYAPTGTNVGSPDSATIPGIGTFEVDGSPNAWPVHPMTGWQPAHSVVVKLKAVSG